MDTSFGRGGVERLMWRRAWLAVVGGVVLGAAGLAGWGIRTAPAAVAGDAASDAASVAQVIGAHSDCGEGHGWDIVQETPSGEYQATGRETFRLLN